MIIIVLIALSAGVAYYILLSHYAKMWDDIDVSHGKLLKSTCISVLVPFRNEAENLPTLIRSFEELQMQSYEVEYIFVNDHSTDSGEQQIANYTGVLNIKLINSTESSGKKAAMRLGWERSIGDIILQTDADCQVPVDWFTEMLAPFDNEEVLLTSGPVLFYPEKSFWKQLVNLDFMGLIAIGAAHIQWGKPMICNAANLAYRRELISTAQLNDEVASGDDVFLLQSAYQQNTNSIRFVKCPEAIVQTAGPASFSEFWHQRLRWSSKNGAYDIKENTWLLAGIWMFNVLIIFCLLTFSAIGATCATFLVILKVLAEDKFYGRFCYFFGKELWFTNILLGQPFHILYMAIVPPLSQVLKYQWKERKVSK